MDEKLFEYLKKHGIEYKEHKHPAVFSVEETEKLNLDFQFMHTKSLFLKDDKSRFYLVCMDAFKRLDMKFLRKHLHVNKLHFSSSGELKEKLNLTPGSVSIFGLINSKDVFLILDRSIWEADSVGFHPNINTSTLEINHENFEKYVNLLSIRNEIVKL
ncbi:prolyl-tRNA synthetase associated domain-containing protein [Candidatus Pacearchaeota archaeon]|nr:prolyl-tRNA synthetase associated domain-containing protein [Candidatus Pacearchaeota archaeon]